ncbi:MULTISPECIES: phage tail assembly chaperone [unclassified Pseudomonas]|uniref:phage tail assembly chaperone n=1 Tax=unclassified Pseudomonas TaxID=196821 RepID=UPI0015A4AD98|nr:MULTISPECIES: phage tail assembly chaperone [unclassified Pseudomonas]NWC92610.1 hypothetical protein [Pseudomonas sp. IPO3779]NWD15607.1 hypothetical protein [Pseudomonas sp. IPO3778]
MDKQEDAVTEYVEPVAPAAQVGDIQRRKDNSYTVTLNGYPFHVTEQDTPEVYQQVLADIAAGASVTDYADPVPSDEQLAATARAWRDGEISVSQWLVDRHRDQVEAGAATTLTADQFSALLVYRQALRDWPAVTDFPADATKPAAPGWLAAAEEAPTSSA